MLEELVAVGYELLGSCLDNLSTIAFCSRYGAKCETNESARRDIEKYGLTKGIIKSEIKNQAMVLGMTGGLYIVDILLGTDNEQMNLHKGILYGFGSLRYVASLINYVGLNVLNRKNRDSTHLLKTFKNL